VNFPDARLIHASIRVHPSHGGGVPHTAPLGPGDDLWRSWWATDGCPQEERGFASHRGILTLQFLAPHSVALPIVLVVVPDLAGL
jgi:hypothetical protein